MAQNQAALILAALQEVGRVGEGQTPSSGDTTIVTSRIAPFLASIHQRRLTNALVDSSTIPDQLFPDLVTLLAEQIAPWAGRSVDEERRGRAEARLRELARLDRAASTALARAVLERLEAAGASADAVDATAVSAAVQSVLDSLAQRRVCTIANEAAITSAQTPALVTLTAARIQPKAASADLVAAAEEDLRRINRLDRTLATPLVRAILEQLEMYEAGRNVLDAQAVSDRLPGILAELAARNVTAQIDPLDVDDAVLPDLSRYVAASLTTPAVYPVMQDAERRLRAMRPDPAVYPPMRGSYW